MFAPLLTVLFAEMVLDEASEEPEIAVALIAAAVVVPVTPSVPPTVALLVTVRVPVVVLPEIAAEPAVTAPVTCAVFDCISPLIVAFPVTLMPLLKLTFLRKVTISLKTVGTGIPARKSSQPRILPGGIGFVLIASP